MQAVRRPGKKLSEDDIKRIAMNLVNDSISYTTSEISERRNNLYDRYKREPYGDEVAGRSQVISSDILDVVESMLPDLIEIFTGDGALEFTPNGAEDVNLAKQATQYVKFVMNVDNDGFVNLYDFCKDCLLQINGFFKTYWDETPVVRRETYTGLSDAQLLEILGNERADPVAYTAKIDGIPVDEYEDAFEDPGDVEKARARILALQRHHDPSDDDQDKLGEVVFGEGVTHDITVLLSDPTGRCVIETVPPEEMLIQSNARSFREHNFIAQRTRKARYDLIADGYDEAKVMRLERAPYDASFDGSDTRRSASQDASDTQSPDPLMDFVWVTDCYLKTDIDGDGHPEWHQVILGGHGSTHEMLDHGPVDDQPFDTASPIRLPHQTFGMAVAELVEDIQKIKTAVLRQLLDNQYGANSNRLVVWEDKIDIEDVLDNRVNGPIRASAPVGDVVLPLPPQSLAHIGLPMLEYIDTAREIRTGSTRYNQGLDSDSLNKTATGITRILDQAQKRVRLIAHLLAECGLKPLLMRVFTMLRRYQQGARIVRLTGEQVTIDPSVFEGEFDVTVNIGVGTTDRQARAMIAQAILQMQKELILLQGGRPDGPMVTLDTIHNALSMFVRESGLKHPELYFADPKGKELPPPQPDPKTQETQAKMQVEQAKIQMEAQFKERELALKEREMNLTHERETLKIQMDAELKQQELEQKERLEREKIDVDREKIATTAATARETAKQKGNGKDGRAN